MENSYIISTLNQSKRWHDRQLHYIIKAINVIKMSKLNQTFYNFDNNRIEQDVNLIANKFKLLTHKNSNIRFFMVIIKWFIEYYENNNQKQREFINYELDIIIATLLKITNDKLYNKLEDIKKMSFVEFEKIIKQINIYNININTQCNNAKYNIIPISNYEELHWKYSNKTGYKGDSEWCYITNQLEYRMFTKDNNNYKFFILEKDNWQNIKPSNPITLNTAYDEYGMSLIALLVDIKSFKLVYSTLRWNNIIIPITGAVDNAFYNWHQLNSAIGFDVKQKCKDIIEWKELRYQPFQSNKQYNIGDIFQTTFDNKIIDMIILDIKNGKYIVQPKEQIDKPQIFDKKTNKWKDSFIRKYLNSAEFINRFDSTFISHIVETDVYTEDYITKDKFWLLSHEEVYCQINKFNKIKLNNIKTNNFKYFNNKNKQKKNCIWRLRSICTNITNKNTMQIASINKFGDIEYCYIHSIYDGALLPACIIV